MQKKERTKNLAPLWKRAFSFILEFTPKRIGIVLLVGLICAVLSFTASKSFLKPVYSSTITLAIMNERPEKQSHIQNLSSCYQFAQTLAVSGRNLDAAQHTIDRMGIDLTPNQLLSKIRVTRKEKTMLVRVTATDQDPVMAKELVQVYTDEMLAKLSETLFIHNPRQLQGPTNPRKALSSRSYAVSGAILGCLLAILFFYLKYRSKRAVRMEEDLAPFGKPLIGKIGTLNTDVRPTKRGGAV